MNISAGGETNVGVKRPANEDNFLRLDEELLYVVADGMGGHSSGEVASQIAVDGIANFYNATSQDEDITWPYKMDKNRPYDENRMIMSVKLANLRIFEASQSESRYRGMGTTVAGFNFVDDHALVAHVGDSRVYRIRNQQIMQLTEDHSLLNDYIKAKKLTPEEIENFPHKNVIVRALGMKDSVLVDLNKFPIVVGDIYLACSDGLSGMITDEQILEIVNTTTNLDKACKILINKANEAGGIDNITVVIARVDSL
jgi:protein phosphatase